MSETGVVEAEALSTTSPEKPALHTFTYQQITSDFKPSSSQIEWSKKTPIADSAEFTLLFLKSLVVVAMGSLSDAGQFLTREQPPGVPACPPA